MERIIMSVRHLRQFTVITILAIFFLGACNMPRGATPTEANPGLIYTIAAKTVEAELTQAALPPSTTEQPPPAASPTTQDPAKPEQPDDPTPTPSNTPTDTPPAPSNTPAPSATATEIPCDQLTFIKDVTIPDDTEMQPGENFKKTWRLKNTGSCTWTSGYSLIFEDGDAMGAPASVQLTTGTVTPGQEYDITIDLTAPDDPGTYRGNFKLRNPAGVVFGFGDDAKPFWVQIVVPDLTGVMFDFISNASSSDWGSGAAPVDFSGPGHDDLSFGGPDDAAAGSAMIKDKITFENGGTSGKVLETRPKNENDGYVIGRYPEYKVGAGDRIKGRLGFAAKADGSCGAGNVVFEIHYTEGTDLGTRTRLGSWQKACDRKMMPIDVGLSALKGKTVRFYLVILANGQANQDWAVWSSLGVMR
jgi:hypothetical protein